MLTQRQLQRPKGRGRKDESTLTKRTVTVAAPRTGPALQAHASIPAVPLHDNYAEVSRKRQELERALGSNLEEEKLFRSPPNNGETFMTWQTASSSVAELVYRTGPGVQQATVHQAYVQERGMKGQPDRLCQDYIVAFNHCLSSLPFDRHGCSTDQYNRGGLPLGPHLDQKKQLCVAAVYDGHGVGIHAPQLAQALTLSRLLSNTCLLQAMAGGRGIDQGQGAAARSLSDVDVVNLLKGWASFYQGLDDDILADSRRTGHMNGTTALVALCYEDRLYCSNAGDSRAVLSRHGHALRISRDHTPGLSDEYERITRVAGRDSVRVMQREARVVLTKGSVRKACAVSRALGDRDFKEAGLMICQPDVFATRLLPQRDAFFIAASDGLWCCVEDQEAVDVVQGVCDQAAHLCAAVPGSSLCASMGGAITPHAIAQVAAAQLRVLARQRGSTDDISIMVNLLDWGAAPSPPAAH